MIEYIGYKFLRIIFKEILIFIFLFFYFMIDLVILKLFFNKTNMTVLFLHLDNFQIIEN